MAHVTVVSLTRQQRASREIAAALTSIAMTLLRHSGENRNPVEEMATVAIAEHDAEVRFHVRTARGRGKTARGLMLLRKAAGTRS